MTPDNDARDHRAANVRSLHGVADNGEQHDLELIAERLDWTPAQRLDANAAFLRF